MGDHHQLMDAVRVRAVASSALISKVGTNNARVRDERGGELLVVKPIDSSVRGRHADSDADEREGYRRHG